jgi:hypothetical protein
VHGLGGSPLRTWTRQEANKLRELASGGKKHTSFQFKELFKNKNKSATTAQPATQDVFWPRDLLPNVVKNARIMTYGYESTPLAFGRAANKNSIFEHAQNMLNAAQRQRESNVLFLLTCPFGIKLI